MQADTADLDAALPDYEVGDRLGEGQFGVVWAARHRRLDRPVALKQLTGTAVADPRNAERFRREARLLAQLDHRHVVRVYDYRETGGLSLLIMERLTGGTFADRRATGLGFESIIVSVIAAASGLHHLHLQGVLHRDVKPANLMFDGNNILKVTDFGTARGQSILTGDNSNGHSVPHDLAIDVTVDVRDAMELSFAGEFMGTPGFAAPEQAAAALGLAAAAVGPAADQYALAAVLYQSLTGCYTHSIDGGTIALLTRRATTPARAADVANPAVPQRLSAVMMLALERAPDDRFGSVEEFALALTTAAAAEWGPDWAQRSAVSIAEPGRLWDAVHGKTSEPAVGTGPAASHKRNSRRRIALLALIGALIAATVVIVMPVIRPATSEDSSASAQPTTAAELPLTLVSDWRTTTGGNVFASPTVLDDMVVVGSMDGTIYSLNRESGEPGWQVPTGKAVRSSAAVSGGLVIVGGDDGVLRAIWHATGQPLRQQSVGFEIVSSPVVSNGLAIVGADKLYAFDALTGEPKWASPTGGLIVSSPAVAGDTVVVGGMDGFVYGFSVTDGSQQWLRDTGGPVVAGPVIADGVAYIGSRSGALLAVTAATGGQVWSHPVGGAVNGAVVVAGDQVLVGTDAGTVTSLQRATAKEQWTRQTTGRIDAGLALLDGTLVVGSTSGRILLLDIVDGDGVGEYSTGGPVLSSPRVADRQIFVGSYDDSVYRLHIAPK